MNRTPALVHWTSLNLKKKNDILSRSGTVCPCVLLMFSKCFGSGSLFRSSFCLGRKTPTLFLRLLACCSRDSFPLFLTEMYYICLRMKHSSCRYTWTIGESGPKRRILELCWGVDSGSWKCKNSPMAGSFVGVSALSCQERVPSHPSTAECEWQSCACRIISSALSQAKKCCGPHRTSPLPRQKDVELLLVVRIRLPDTVHNTSFGVSSDMPIHHSVVVASSILLLLQTFYSSCLFRQRYALLQRQRDVAFLFASQFWTNDFVGTETSTTVTYALKMSPRYPAEVECVAHLETDWLEPTHNPALFSALAMLHRSASQSYRMFRFHTWSFV